MEVGFDGVPLFWLELFDHSTKQSIDFSCHKIEEAVAICDDFMSQAAAAN